MSLHNIHVNYSFWPIGCLLVVYGLILDEWCCLHVRMKKTEVTRQVRFPFSATKCGIWCRHDLWCVTQIKYLFPVIQVITNIHHYIIGKLQWHSNSCEMTDEMWKLIEINCETTVVVKTTSCLPRSHPIFTRLSSKTCSGMVPHKIRHDVLESRCEVIEQNIRFLHFCSDWSQNWYTHWLDL